MDEDDVNDPVVSEIPVFLSQKLAEEIHVIQYPLRPFYRPLDLPTTVSVKPVHHMLEQNHNLDLGDSYNHDAPEHLQIRQQKMKSATIDPSTHYAIGIMRQGQLHLTPVNRTYQMRPSFDHIDEANAAASEAELETQKNDGSFAPEPAAMKQLQVQFKKKESEKTAMYREKSYGHKKSQEDAEEWVELAVHAPTDDESKEAINSLVYADESADFSEPLFEASSTGYLKSMRYSQDAPSNADAPTDAPTEAPTSNTLDQDIDKMNCEDQVRSLLGAAQLMSFTQVRQLATRAQSTEELLAYLQQFAVLVNGFWVLKSDLCYENDEEAIRCRDTILLLLQKSNSVSRNEITHELKASPWCLREMLTAMCNRVRERDGTMIPPHQQWAGEMYRWAFKLEEDSDFIQRHPELAKEYEAFWQKREKELEEAY